MSGKERPGVTRRPNRGRSTHDSKSKTDSGCFVDDELERNCSSDSSQGSISSSSAKETCAKKAKALDKERKLDSLTPESSPEPITVNGNAQECILNLKENVMNEGGACNDKNERTSVEYSDEVCDIVEKTQGARDFYCLYYSASPEGTLTRSGVSKVKSKPPVPPKPKARRGSAPPSSFNNIERICQQNKDITKRYSYNGGDNGTPKPSLENFDEQDKRKSVEERVLFFEGFAKGGLVENHIQAKVTSQSESNLNSVCSGRMDSENVAPLAISKELSFEKSSSESLNLSYVAQEQIPPLVEEEESTINGSLLQKRSINYDAVSGDCHGNTTGRAYPDCISKIDEVEGASCITVEKNPNGVSNISFHESDECYSDLLLVKESRKYLKTNSVDSEIHNDFESFDVSTPEDDSNLQLLSKINGSSEEMQQSSDCSYNATAGHENTQRSLRGSLVNPRINEIRQELPVSSRQHIGHGMQMRLGSIAGISNLEKDLTSQLKRRSWSFSEPCRSPFGQKNYQASSPKLTPTSWQSENGLSLSHVRSCYQDKSGQITPGCGSISQERIGFSSQGQSWPASLEHSGYASDDSSVHSEPLLQLQRRRSQILNNGHKFKSISQDSCISAVDCGMPATSSIQCKRFRHSLGSRIDSRDPIHALRRQSTEFTHDSPLFQPVSHGQVPRLQSLRRTSSNASSSSDSEVERIFSHSEAATPACPQFTKPSIINGLAKTGGKRRVSAMEALFGPQSVCVAQESSDSEQTRKVSHSEKVCEFLPQPPEDEFLSGQLVEEEEEQEIEFDEIEPKGIEEPGLEFDDTDYSEFYTRCEDKDSIISAEALSIKKLLQSPQTVVPDPDIESVVMSVTERRVISTPSQDQNMQESASVACDNDAVDMNAYEVKHCGQFCRQHRGTQTPPAEVFRALSPPPSVGTQTPPLSVSQELLPPSLLRELQKDLQSPLPMMTRTMSPSTLQEWQSSSQDNFQAVSPPCTPFADTDLLSSLQNNADKAVSVEELLQILASMRVGPPNAETPKRRPVSVQKYNCSSTQDVKSRNSTNSLPSSWHHLDDGTTKHDDTDDFKQPSSILPRFSKSYDCLRQGMTREGKRGGLVQAQNVESREDIRQKLKEWRLRSQLFEEEVECLEGKDNLAKANGEKVFTVSFDGSESTENIETESKLTRTHSLKRPRKDRAFSQKERGVCETSCSDEKQQHFSFPAPKRNCEKSKGDGEAKDSSMCSAAEVSKLELTSDPLFLEKLQNAVDEPQVNEVASPEGVDVFIDYRKKHGMHITSTPKPPPYPDKGLVCREGGVGEMNSEIPVTESLSTDKPVSTNATEEVPVDLESQGDASSSSYSSDDDRFGEFGGSTDTVVFVDTKHSSGISLVPDLDALDIDLIGNSNLLKIDNDDGKDEDRLDVLLGEVRRSLNLEFVDSDILDKAIDRFKQRVSPGSHDKALSDGLSMEAYVALHQADELQGIISEIKGELKLLHDENDMLREQVVSLANQQTNGEITENSSTESAERLETLFKLLKPKQIPMDTDDDEDPVEVDVCLRGFSVVPLGHLPGKKRDIHLGTVTVKGADWNGVMEAARQAFVEHIKNIDPDGYLCLGAHSIQGVQTGVIVWSPDSLRRKSPRVELSQKRNPCVIQLKDGSHFSCDSLVYDTLLPKETIEKYVEQLLEHRYIMLCGEQGLGKSYLAAKLAEHVVQRIGWKDSPAVVTFNVTQTTRKELKQNLACVMQTDTSSPQESRPAVIVLDQLNCLASLADIFDLSQLEKDRNCPYIIGVRDKSRKGPFSSKELSLCHYFRWLRVSVKDRQYSGLLDRFLRRKLSWTRVLNEVKDDDLSQLFHWLTKVWYHLNDILEEYCEPDSTIGPSLFFSCPMDFKSAEGWFVTVWNYIVIPYLHQALRSGRKIFDRCISWEDPTKWVVLRYPWDKDHSRFLHTLRKLRQVDVVLNRNHLGSDNVCFAECIEENEKILRSHSTVSKRVRTVIQQKVPKKDSKAKRRNAEEMEFLGHEKDKDSCCSDSDSYLETSI